MKGRLIALDHLGGAQAAALMVDGKLEDLVIDPAGPRLGDLHRVRVDRLLKGQGGAMVTTGEGAGYIRRARGLTLGQELLAQVSGFAEPGKALPMTDRPLFKSRYSIVTPGAPGVNVSRSIRDEARADDILELAHQALQEVDLPEGAGVILRSSCEAGEDAEIFEDVVDTVTRALEILGHRGSGPQKLLEGDSAHVLAWREWTDPAQIDASDGSFEVHGIREAIDALASDAAPLVEGGHMWIEETRALVAVDINTGSDTSPAAALKANLTALRALPTELTLRGLGGQVVVDFAPLSKRDRKQVETLARSVFRRGRVETEVIGWTPLGHLELKRKRERAGLALRLKELGL